DKVTGLEAGADDYITKPFGVMELLSRIKAVLRRVKKQEEAEEIRAGDLVIDFRRRAVSYKENPISLTFKEFELLAYLVQNKGIVVKREKLMERVWGYNYEGETRTLDMHIKTLRQKLEQGGCSDLIQTVRGVGYRVD
ncbi:MAG: winged helix-turn-helix domain-containing protein, partial [Ruminiclostridium sp.]